MKKKLTSFILALAMVLSMIPGFAGSPGNDAIIAAPENIVEAPSESPDYEFIVGDIRVQTLSETLVRIELKGPLGFEDRTTYHIIGRDKYAGLPATKTNINGKTRIETSKYRVEIPDNANTLTGVTVTNLYGRVLWEYNYTSVPTSEVFLPAPGNTPSAWALSDNPRVYMPSWGYSTAPNPLPDDAGPENLNGWDNRNNSPDMYVFIPMGDAKQLRKDFNTLTGESQMIPFKALGLWHSRYNKYLRDGFLALVDEYRENGFPIDYMVIDTDWRSGSGGTGYNLALDVFPPTDPEDNYSGLRKFLNETLPSKNIQTIFNDHPESTGGSRLPLHPTEVAFRTTNLTKYLGIGLDAWWFDRNWNNVIQSPLTGINKESYGMYIYHDVTERFFETHPDYADRGGKRALTMGNVDGVDHSAWNRAPNVASHRFTFQWTGDSYTYNQQLKNDLEVLVGNGAITATPYISGDLGGHNYHAASHQYVRWSQFGALSPFMRYHSYTPTFREPFKQGQIAENVSREYVGLRYRLLPLFYALAHENYETGMPLARRLDFNYPSYAEAQDNTQYTLGNGILVAPIHDAMQTGQATYVASKAPANITESMTTPVVMNHSKRTMREWVGTFTNTGDEEIVLVYTSDRPALAWMNKTGIFDENYTAGADYSDDPIFSDPDLGLYLTATSANQLPSTVAQRASVRVANTPDNFPTNYLPAYNTPTKYFYNGGAYSKKDLVLERPSEARMNGVGLVTGSVQPSYLGYIKPGETVHVRVVLPWRDSASATWSNHFQYVRKSQMDDTRTVFIPDGRWIDVWNGNIVEGPKTITVTHNVETSPIFVRSGTIVPLATNLKDNGETIASSEDSPWTKLTVDVYPSAVLSASQTIYEDDGVSNAHKSGSVRKTDLSTSFDKATDEVVVNIGAAKGDFEPFYENHEKITQRTWNVRVHIPKDWGRLTGVTVGGRAITDYTIISQETGKMPFAFSGAAPDGDVIELAISNAPLSQSHEIRLKFSSYIKEDVTGTVDSFNWNFSELSANSTIGNNIEKKNIAGAVEPTGHRAFDNLHSAGVPGTNAERATNIIVNDGSTKWCQGVNVNNAWFILDAGTSIKLPGYIIRGANDDMSYASRRLHTWIVQGSDSPSGPWTTISAPTAQGAGWTSNYQTRAYMFDSDAIPNEGFRYYRLQIIRYGNTEAGTALGTSNNTMQFSYFGLIDSITETGSLEVTVNNSGVTGKAGVITLNSLNGPNVITVNGNIAKTASAPVAAKNYTSIKKSLSIEVNSDTKLGYIFKPSNAVSSHMALDVIFSDGTSLQDLKGVDQFGVTVHPKDQGESMLLKPGQWNYVETDLGKIANGKVVKEIIIGFEVEGAAPGEEIEGSFDNIMVFRGDGDFGEAKIYAAIYNAEDNLIDVKTSDTISIHAFSTVTLNPAFTIDLSDVGEGGYARLYLWNADNYKPLTVPVRYYFEPVYRSTTLTPAPSSLNLTAGGFIDWVKVGVSSSVNLARKAGADILPDPYFSTAQSRFTDYPTQMTWTDGTPTASASNNQEGRHTAGGTAGAYYTVSAPSSRQFKRLDLYVGLWNSTGNIEIFDESGDKIDTYTLTGGSTSNTQKISTYFRSEEDSVLTIRVTMLSGSGNVSLAGYTLSEVTDAELLDMTMGQNLTVVPERP